MSKRQHWTPEQTALVAQHYATMPGPQLAAMLGVKIKSLYTRAWAMGLKKSRETIAQQAREHMLNPAHPARQSRFQPGLTPWNKGKPFESGGNSHKTRFKPGNKPHTTLPTGAYRLVHEMSTGRWVLEQKTGNATGPSHLRWTPVSRLVWQAANGPIPHGHLVVFKPGMFTHALDDITPDKLECISRGEHVRRNSPGTKNPELGKLVQLKGAITRQVNRIAREAAQTQGAKA